jgi:hypothetical protein
MLPGSEHVELKQQEDAMDPITALNQEFARLVQEDWSCEAADRRSEQAAPAPHTNVVARLQALVGAGLSALGMWLKTPSQPIGAERE